MVYFFDNDNVLKLAACDLLDDALLVLGINRTEIRVLHTAQYVVKKRYGQGKLAKYGDNGVHRALEFFQSSTPIFESPDPDEHQLLTDVDGIDQGEAILYSATKSEDNFFLLTGDKRSLQALQASDTCGAIRARLNGKVICLEQIILSIIYAIGFERTREKILNSNGAGCDSVLTFALNTGSKRDCFEGLVSYCNALRRNTGDMLIPWGGLQVSQQRIVIRDIEMGISPIGGMLLPTALFEPVEFDGAVTSRAPLHWERILRDQIKIGDGLLIERIGDVSALVVDVLTQHRQGRESELRDIPIPSVCPICGDGLVGLRCPNSRPCPAQAARTIGLVQPQPSQPGQKKTRRRS